MKLLCAITLIGTICLSSLSFFIHFHNLAHIDVSIDHQTIEKQILSVEVHTTRKSQLRTTNDSSAIPSFVLHVGPLKTATTSLQCALTSLASELEKDGYRYIGRSEEACRQPSFSKEDDELRLREEQAFEWALLKSRQCRTKLSKLEPPSEDAELKGNPGPISDYDCWGKFISLLENYRRNGTSIIYSEENMSSIITSKEAPFPFRHLKRALVGWNFKVLVVHRRLYDWMPSAHNEYYKPGPLKRRLNKWPGIGMCVNRGGKDVPTVLDNVSMMTKHPGITWPDALQVVRAVQSSGVQVALERFEGAGSILAHVVCNLPGKSGAPTACHKLSQHGYVDSLPRNNPSASLHYDMLAVAACKTGAIDGRLIERPEFRDRLEEFIQGVNGSAPLTLPLDCPKEVDLSPILQVSLKDEQNAYEMWGMDWGKKEKDMHEEQFVKDTNPKEGRKYCVVDSKAALKEETIKHFFAKLMMSRRVNTQIDA